jgi:NTE family protein
MVATMTTAFVLSGGGNLGSIQVGMLRALFRAGIRPDFIVGTSVGSLNGAWLAAHGKDADLQQLVDVWIRMKRTNIFPTDFVGGFRGFVGQRDHLVSSSGLQRVIRREVDAVTFSDLQIPLHVVATDITTGEDVLLNSGSLSDAVCASAAIPGIFPMVTINGRRLVDGGVVNNCPISQAIALGATTIWVLPCGYACSLQQAPVGALGTILQAISLLIQNRLCLDFDRYKHVTDLRMLPTLCPVKVSPTDFSQASRLIAESDALVTDWLRDPAVGQQPGLHHHAMP